MYKCNTEKNYAEVEGNSITVLATTETVIKDFIVILITLVSNFFYEIAVKDSLWKPLGY